MTAWRRILGASCSMLAIALGSAEAATGRSDGIASRATTVERVLAQEVRDEIGKSYWVRGGTASNQVFCDARDFPKRNCKSGQFGPAQSERFTIEAINTDHPRSREHAWFRIRFDSGRTGYLNADTLRSQMFVPLRHQMSSDTAVPIWELFFHERPEAAIARVQQRVFDAQKQATRVQEEHLERGAARLGMTKQQVLNSAWGTPERIRAGAIGARQREEWVYSAGTLYFEDGILMGVQTAR